MYDRSAGWSWPAKFKLVEVMSLEDESGGSLRDPSRTFFETKSKESSENFNTANFKSFSQTSGLTNDEESFDFSRSSPSLRSDSTIRRRSSDNESGGGSLCSANISSDEESEGQQTYTYIIIHRCLGNRGNHLM